MLGYVRAYKAELKVRDYELYRGIYCSLCRALGRNYSPFSQLLLSYDFTLAAMIRLAVSENGCTFSQKRCPYNPAKKCLDCSKKEIFDICAHAVIITAYYKVIDNIEDSKGLKKLAAILLYPFIALMHKKAKRLAPEIENAVSQAMKMQSEAETKQNIGIDEAAHPSADALGKIFALDSGENQDSLYRFGYMVGRFIYILDAADDIEDDIKHKSFNPFKNDYPGLSSEGSGKEFADRIEKMLNLTQSQILEAFDAIKVERFGSIIENISLDGLGASAEAVLGKYRGKAEKQKSFSVR
ncbi:MAG: DUF5685 family protein [Clostridia bacterium]|nr:DUF5685 family protein [Clostridia bacterium]